METFPVPYKAASVIPCNPHWVVTTLGSHHTGWPQHLQCSTEFSCSIVFSLHQTKFPNTGCLSAQAFDVNLMSHYEDECVYLLALPFPRIHNLSQRNPSKRRPERSCSRSYNKPRPWKSKELVQYNGSGGTTIPECKFILR